MILLITVLGLKSPYFIEQVLPLMYLWLFLFNEFSICYLFSLFLKMWFLFVIKKKKKNVMQVSQLHDNTLVLLVHHR